MIKFIIHLSVIENQAESRRDVVTRFLHGQKHRFPNARKIERGTKIH